MKLSEAVDLIDILKVAKQYTKEALIYYGSLKEYKKGEYIFLDRSKVDNVYFLVKGTVALYKLNKHGEKRVIFVYGKPAILNEVIIQNEVSSVNCEVLEESLLLSFNREQFIELMKNDFNFTKAIMDELALKVRRLYHQLKNTCNNTTIDKQIAAKLWKLSKDNGIKGEIGIEINFDLSITYLAELLGSRRETVSRAVKILTNNKLITVKKNRFYVIDRELLLQYFKDV